MQDNSRQKGSPIWGRIFTSFFAIFASCPGGAQTTTPPEAAQPQDAALARRLILVEEYTANTLDPGEVKIGLNLDVAPVENFMIGTDLLATTIGVPTLQMKYRIGQWNHHALAVGLRGAYLTRSTMLWGTAKKHFDVLEARILRPSISWTNHISPRLNIHTYWATATGSIAAELSEEGKRKLWESKHPNLDYDKRGTNGDNPEGSANNQEEPSSEGPATYAQRTSQVQSLTGLMSDLFQVTGEFRRGDDKKVLLTSRIESNEFKQLTSKSFRLTAAQQWIWEHFQFRFGIGLQYLIMSGFDLDGEKVDEEAVLPATDIDFYWRF